MDLLCCWKTQRCRWLNDFITWSVSTRLIWQWCVWKSRQYLYQCKSLLCWTTWICERRQIITLLLDANTDAIRLNLWYSQWMIPTCIFHRNKHDLCCVMSLHDFELLQGEVCVRKQSADNSGDASWERTRKWGSIQDCNVNEDSETVK